MRLTVKDCSWNRFSFHTCACEVHCELWITICDVKKIWGLSKVYDSSHANLIGWKINYWRRGKWTKWNFRLYFNSRLLLNLRKKLENISGGSVQRFRVMSMWCIKVKIISALQYYLISLLIIDVEMPTQITIPNEMYYKLINLNKLHRMNIHRSGVLRNENVVGISRGILTWNNRKSIGFRKNKYLTFSTPVYNL